MSADRFFFSTVDRLANLSLSEKEEILRSKFLREARFSNPEKGYIDVPWVNQLIRMDLQGYAADILVAIVKDKGWNIKKVAGVPTMGGYLANSVAERIPGVLFAPGRKGSGTPGLWKTTVVIDGQIPSFTTEQTSQIVFNGLEPGDQVLFVDDFTASGATMIPILEKCEELGIEAYVATYCAKLFQPGMSLLRAKGYDPIAVLGIDRRGDDLVLTSPHF